MEHYYGGINAPTRTTTTGEHNGFTYAIIDETYPGRPTSTTYECNCMTKHTEAEIIEFINLITSEA